MNELLASLLTTAALLATWFTFPPWGEPEQDSSPEVGFGTSFNGVDALTAAGVKPEYGSFWIGPWTLTSGWGGPDALMDRAYAEDVTPVIHFYYWGDDISPSCVENGCWSSLHHAQKTRAGWDRLGIELADHLNARMKGEPAVVLLETEFNKGGIESYEPFDDYLAQKAGALRKAYPAAEIVLPFGNWGADKWGNFDRAAAASQMTGVQGMRGSTRDSPTHYYDLPDTLLAATQRLQQLFGKPVMITDIALSSYPEPEYTEHQTKVLQRIFDRMPQYQEAGVAAVLYRGVHDTPTMDLANHYGHAERHWGLMWSEDNPKPSFDVWKNGVQAATGGQPAQAPAVPAMGPLHLEPERIATRRA